MTSKLNLKMLSAQVLNNWENRVRIEVDTAGDLLRPALINHLPQFLGFLADALSEKKSQGLLMEASALVRAHAEERARVTSFGPQQIVQEYQILRQVVTEALETVMRLSTIDYETIQLTFDQSIQEGLVEFFRIHTKLREQFTVTLAHDLRNPVGIASMAADLINESANKIENSEIKDEILFLASRIYSNMNRADRMIQDLLNASLLKIGEKLPVKISKFDLLALTEHIINQIEDDQRSRLKLEGSHLVGYWDMEGLRRCLENLIQNAIKYGASDTPIEVRIEPHNSNILIHVHNSGNPIPAKEQELIFQNFGRSDSAIHKGLKGWGIGLAYVRAMTESLGGSTKVESSPEHGTTFTISIPQDCRPSKSVPDLNA